MPTLAAVEPLVGWEFLLGVESQESGAAFEPLSPAVVPLKGTWGWILRFSENLRFLRFFVKCILAVNPSGMRDMETGVPPLKPAGPGGFFCIINIVFYWIQPRFLIKIRFTNNYS